MESFFILLPKYGLTPAWFIFLEEYIMEFFGFTLFGALSGGPLLAIAAVLFIVGLVLVIKGGDWFVDSASWYKYSS